MARFTRNAKSASLIISRGKPFLEIEVNDDKIIELGDHMPVEDAVRGAARSAATELDLMIKARKDAAESLKLFSDELKDEAVLGEYEAKYGVKGAMNVIYAAFPTESRESLEDMLASP